MCEKEKNINKTIHYLKKIYENSFNLRNNRFFENRMTQMHQKKYDIKTSKFKIGDYYSYEKVEGLGNFTMLMNVREFDEDSNMFNSIDLYLKNIFIITNEKKLDEHMLKDILNQNSEEIIADTVTQLEAMLIDYS